MANLRNRPFLVIDLYHKPAGPANGPHRSVVTERAGWGKIKTNWTMDERPSIVNRISDKIMAQAAVIIDLHNNKLIKSRFTQNTPEETMNHFLSRYADDVAPFMALKADSKELLEKLQTMLAEEVAKEAEQAAEDQTETETE